MKLRNKIIISLIALLSLSVTASCQEPDSSLATMETIVLRAYDGDTVSIRGGERVRYLGIDTPEMGEEFGDAAKRLNKDLVGFKTVRLEFDEQKRDVYGRLLAYVYVKDGDTWKLVNAELLRAGLARLLIIPPNYRYTRYLEQAVHEAKVQHKGIWGEYAQLLAIDELLADPVRYVTEVVTVRFVVGSQQSTKAGLILRPEGDWIPFSVLIVEDTVTSVVGSSADLPISLEGERIDVTGTLTCFDPSEGLRIVVQYPDQIRFEED